MPLPPVATRDRFPGERAALLALLRDLPPDGWDQPTVCSGWNVHDVALHILGGDIGWLSGGRDRFRGSSTAPPTPNLDDWDTLVGWIDDRNAIWVDATRRIGPPLLTELLAFTGARLERYLATIDLGATGIPVSWAGPDPAPTWLHVAREYTERWVHQQHIRDAVNRPGLTERQWLHPVLDTFARALPHTLRDHVAPPGYVVTLCITGGAGGSWSVRRTVDGWRFAVGPDRPDTVVTMDAETAWRGFTRGIGLEAIRARIRVKGDPGIGDAISRMTSIIA